MAKKQVLVTGATGRTGSLLVKKLQQLEDFKVVGFARSPEKANKLFETTDEFYFGDIKSKSDLQAALSGCQALVILTSAAPVIVAPPKQGERPKFAYPSAGTPELIDYQGQKNQTVVQALKHLSAREKAFDLISKPETDSSDSITKDFASLFSQATAAHF